MKIPTTVGIIMDGNRRFAKERGLPSFEGHRIGSEKFKELLVWVKDYGITNVVAFAFSNENWKRAEVEVSYLFELFRIFFSKEIESFNKEGGIVKCVGDIEKLPEDIQKLCQMAEEKTKNNSGPRLYLALSYGGREEILNAVRKIIKEGVKKEDVTEESFSKKMWTGEMPDPDIIIRTGGEKRLSGFLPWQGVYSELFFTDTYWPAFSKEEFLSILKEYSERERRFGI